MLTFVRAENDSGIPLGYGLGIERYELPGGVEVIGHMGTAAGYRAFVGHLSGQKVDVAMVINAGQAGDPTPVIIRAIQLMVAEAS